MPTGNESARFIGQVESIWKGKAQNQSCLYVKLTLFNVGPLHKFSNMNVLINQNEVGMCRAKVIISQLSWTNKFQGNRLRNNTILPHFWREIVASLNVQHDCILEKCSFITNPFQPKGSQEEVNKPSTIIQHKDDRSYILNAASLASISWHQKFSSLTHPPITSEQWKSAVQHGMKKWSLVTFPQPHTAFANPPILSSFQFPCVIYLFLYTK